VGVHPPLVPAPLTTTQLGPRIVEMDFLGYKAVSQLLDGSEHCGSHPTGPLARSHGHLRTLNPPRLARPSTSASGFTADKSWYEHGVHPSSIPAMQKHLLVRCSISTRRILYG
jgi:hypothetical protein